MGAVPMPHVPRDVLRAQFRGTSNRFLPPLCKERPHPLSLPAVIFNKPEFCAGPALRWSKRERRQGSAPSFVLLRGEGFWGKSARSNAAACPGCSWSPSKPSEPRGRRCEHRDGRCAPWGEASGCAAAATRSRLPVTFVGKEGFFFFHVSVQFLARAGKAEAGVLLHAGVWGAVGDVQEQSQEGSGLRGAHERVPPLSGEAEDSLSG